MAYFAAVAVEKDTRRGCKYGIKNSDSVVLNLVVMEKKVPGRNKMRWSKKKKKKNKKADSRQVSYVIGEILYHAVQTAGTFSLSRNLQSSRRETEA